MDQIKCWLFVREEDRSTQQKASQRREPKARLTGSVASVEGECAYSVPNAGEIILVYCFSLIISARFS